MNKKQITKIAREHGTSYTNRNLPGEPAFAFGNESWATFCDALIAAKPVQPINEDKAVAWRWSDSNGKHWFSWTTDWTLYTRAKELECLIEFAQPTDTHLPDYMDRNYPDAKGESLAQRVINVIETMDIALGMQEVKTMQRGIENSVTAYGLAVKEIGRLVDENFGRMPQSEWADKVRNLYNSSLPGQQKE